MPIVTRTVAKGIPPKQQSSAKPKCKVHKRQKNLKRQVDSEDDNSPLETSNSEDLEPKAKKKWQRKESSTEVEEDIPTQEPVEEVKDIGTTSNDNTVSVTSTDMAKDSQTR